MYTYKYLYLQAERSGGGDVRNKESGKLLYALATQMKSQIRTHMPLIASAIAKRKINSELQLKGDQNIDTKIVVKRRIIQRLKYLNTWQNFILLQFSFLYWM